MSAVLMLLSFLCLAGVACVTILEFPYVGIQATAVMYLIGNILYSVAIVSNERYGGISLIVGFFYLVFVAVPAAVQVHAGVFPFGLVTYSDAQLGRGYLLLSLSQVLYVVGARVGRRWAGAVPPAGAGLSGGNSREIRWAVLFALLSVIIAAIVGPAGLFASREERGADLGAGGTSEMGFAAQLHYVGQSLSLVALIGCLYWFRGQARSAKNMCAVVTLLGICVVVLVLNYPPALPRFQLLGILLAILTVFVSFFRTRAKVLFLVGGALFVVLVFGPLKSLGSGSISWSSMPVSEYLIRVDFDGFKQITDTLIYADSSALRHGLNFLGVILFFVPRGLWSDKPIPSGTVVSEALGYPYTNVSSPLPAEGYISFGWVGAVVTMIGFGVMNGWIEQRVRSGEIGSPGLIGYSLMAGYATIIMRGSLNAVAPMFMTAFAAVLTMSVVRRVRSRTASDTSAGSRRSSVGLLSSARARGGGAGERSLRRGASRSSFRRRSR